MLALLATACVSEKSIVRFESRDDFESRPALVWKDEYVCVTYKTAAGLVHPVVVSRREGGDLLFFVHMFISALAHTHDRQWIELNQEEEALALKGRVFWLDPDGSLHPLRFESAEPEQGRE